MTGDERFRIESITLDDRLVVRRTPEIEHERATAIFDIIDSNRFRLPDGPPGPYAVHLSIIERRLIMEISTPAGPPPHRIDISLARFRTTIRQYLIVCENYYEAIKRLSPSRIEAIDMGRRALHDEGAEKLLHALSPSAELDHDTARRLFTLLCVLQLRT